MKNSNSFLKTGLALACAAFLFQACAEGGNTEAEANSIKAETMAIHDEIMPQISTFDRQVIKIDSLLINLPDLIKQNAELDTAQVRTDLTALKTELSGATDSMMEWMMGFKADHEGKSAEEIKAYYASELEKVKEMKIVFENASKNSAEKLANF